MVKITPVQKNFVTMIEDIDLSCTLNRHDLGIITNAFETFGVVIFRSQSITIEQQIAFSRRFGPLEPSVRRHRKRAISNVYISDISNVGPDGTIMDEASEAMSYNRGNQLWHSDSSFKKIPSKASLLYALETPPSGGETEFCDMRAAWDSLESQIQIKIENLTVEHSLAYSRGIMGYNAEKHFSKAEKIEASPVLQPLVRESDISGRKSLYLGSHASQIMGMKEKESRTLLDTLLTHASQKQFVHVHAWSPGDLIMWDNRCINHRGRPWSSQKYRRVMRRTTVGGEGFDEEAALAI